MDTNPVTSSYWRSPPSKGSSGSRGWPSWPAPRASGGPGPEQAAERFDIEEPTAAGTLMGEADVEGRPEELSEKLAGLLAREGMGPFGPVKIVACNDRELVFESSGPAHGSPGISASGCPRRPVPVHLDRLADSRRVRHRGAVRAAS